VYLVLVRLDHSTVDGVGRDIHLTADYVIMLRTSHVPDFDNGSTLCFDNVITTIN